MLRLWLYLAGVEASNYNSVEEVHAALVMHGMHEVIVVMSWVFYLLPYVDQVCTQLSAQLLIHVFCVFREMCFGFSIYVLSFSGFMPHVGKNCKQIVSDQSVQR